MNVKNKIVNKKSRQNSPTKETSVISNIERKF